MKNRRKGIFQMRIGQLIRVGSILLIVGGIGVMIAGTVIGLPPIIAIGISTMMAGALMWFIGRADRRSVIVNLPLSARQ
jgi:hypothetical protein